MLREVAGWGLDLGVSETGGAVCGAESDAATRWDSLPAEKRAAILRFLSDAVDQPHTAD